MKKKADKPKKPAAKKRGPRITAKKVQREDARPLEVPEIEVHAEDDDHETENDGLSPRRRLFVEALAGPCMGSATRAAMMAGYSPENYRAAAATASRLLNIANIQHALSAALARRRAGPDWVKNRIIELASSSMANVATIGPDGKMNFDGAKTLVNGAMGQILEMKPKTIEGVPGGGEAVVIETTIKMHNPAPYVRMLAEMHGILQSGGETAKPPEQVWFDSSGEFAASMPDGSVPPMPPDVFELPRVAAEEDHARDE